MRPKDTVDTAKQDGLVYRIPWECGIYIGETGRSMHETTLWENANTLYIIVSTMMNNNLFLSILSFWHTKK